MMARRRIGQEQICSRVEQARGGASLDEMLGLIEWAEIDRHLVGIYAAAKGELGWPPSALFKALLLASWHDLSDVKLADAIEDRTSEPHRVCRRPIGLSQAAKAISSRRA
jgi:transposase, IS5 family